MPLSKEWEMFSKWGKEYGDIVSVTDLSATDVSLNSYSEALRLWKSETHRFLTRLLAHPDTLVHHIQKTAGAIILHVAHGYAVQEDEAPFVTLADAAMEQFSLYMLVDRHFAQKAQAEIRVCNTILPALQTKRYGLLCHSCPHTLAKTP
ncbi:hypothetical protein K435DRAFT_798805 [Dendrothele bispora CBS 962.96]|uniref:Uncharacterized protein n=1 Tax=Dendrothele bispora (strain CBS 962.96) TaxID=1314807 RepID=A0A4V4HFD5_DENBC|nr:hypothetical protein K435DRAFT_798795 [Dendrothele bispora CBS 962.96]THU94605.1 hypothetical protein K435DRAFT_798805 [Dendrothele bispora CBS 962.96]